VSRGGIVWLTGLSGAGKSTLAHAVAKQLTRERVEVLDGDDIRTFLTAGLGYTKADRDTNVQRIGYVARMLAKHGVLVFVAAISPYGDTRADLARRSALAGHAFLEVYVNAPIRTVIARDVKGLYKRALAGEIANFTGVNDPYEPPLAPAAEVHTDRQSESESVAVILAAIASHGLA
jgi:adenylylsulfate kinase